MLLAKIKGNKVHFGKLVTFFGGGGWVCLRPTDPLDPLEGVLGGHLLENFPRGGVGPNFKSQGGGVCPPRTPLIDIYGYSLWFLIVVPHVCYFFGKNP